MTGEGEMGWSLNMLLVSAGCNKKRSSYSLLVDVRVDPFNACLIKSTTKCDSWFNCAAFTPADRGTAHM